jgi:hypothetical protein
VYLRQTKFASTWTSSTTTRLQFPGAATLRLESRDMSGDNEAVHDAGDECSAAALAGKE